MSKNNPEHVTMFTFIPKDGCTIVKPHTCKPVPLFIQLTGDHDIDIMIWIRTILQTEDAMSHLDVLEAKLEEMSTSPASAILRYTDKLRESGSKDFELMRDVFTLNSNWKETIAWMRKKKKGAEYVISKFGSKEAVFELTLPEKIIVEKYGYLYEVCDEESEFRASVVSGFKEVLPSPETLTDVVREWNYWQFILDSRRQVNTSASNPNRTPWWWERLDFLVQQLMLTKPVTRAEALAVCEWLLHECSYFSDRDGDAFDKIILNLVGDCEV